MEEGFFQGEAKMENQANNVSLRFVLVTFFLMLFGGLVSVLVCNDSFLAGMICWVGMTLIVANILWRKELDNNRDQLHSCFNIGLPLICLGIEAFVLIWRLCYNFV